MTLRDKIEQLKNRASSVSSSSTSHKKTARRVLKGIDAQTRVEASSKISPLNTIRVLRRTQVLMGTLVQEDRIFPILLTP